MTQVPDELQEQIKRMQKKSKEWFPDEAQTASDSKAVDPYQHSFAKRSEASQRAGATKELKTTEPVQKQEAPKKAEIVPFPRANRIPQDCWVMVPEIIRSCLFKVLKRGSREYVEEKIIFASSDTQILFTGKELDQADCDVFMQALTISQPTGLGSEVRFTQHSFLKSLKRSTGKQNHEWLKQSLKRLNRCNIEIKTKRFYLSGNLIDTCAVDEVTGESYLRFNPEISKALQLQTYISCSDRLRLGTSELAKWLHLYILSQDTQQEHVINTKKLKSLCGSESCIKKFNQNIKRALNALSEKLPQLLDSWNIKNGILSFKKKPFKKPSILKN